MTVTVQDVKRTHAEPTLRRVMLVLTMLIALGAASFGASVVAARASTDASQADVQRAAQLTEQLQAQTVRAERRTYEVRQDTRLLLEAICHQVEAVAQQTELQVQRCPTLAPIPAPSATPGVPTPD